MDEWYESPGEEGFEFMNLTFRSYHLYIIILHIGMEGFENIESYIWFNILKYSQTFMKYEIKTFLTNMLWINEDFIFSEPSFQMLRMKETC